MQHDRTPGSEDGDLLTSPDPAIGPVLSASTNKSKRGWKKATAVVRNQRIAFAVLGGLAGGFGGLFPGHKAWELAMALGAWQLGVHEDAITGLGGLAGAIVG